MANPVSAAADKVTSTIKNNFNAKSLFTLGAFGVVATAGGMLLAPFFAASAGAATVTGATNASVLGSFWAPLVTSKTGEIGVTAGLSKMGTGIVSLGKSAWAVASSSVSALYNGKEFIPAVKAAFAAPAAALA